MERLQRQDLTTIARLLALGLVAGCVPERFWVSFREGLSRLPRPRSGHQARSGDLLLTRIERLMSDGAGIPVEWRERARRTRQYNKYEDTLFILKEYWPGGWKPELRVVGLEHINTALKAGNGAVLWVGHFAASRLAWKKALHESGVAITHLSDSKHGFSRTPFGMRYINPVCTRVEKRYLRERVQLVPNGQVKAMRRLRSCLGENAVISITDLPFSRNTIQAPFLGVTRPFAPGAPALALAAGARLLPVFPIRTGDKAFEIIVEPAIVPPTGGSKTIAVSAMAHEYAARLERYVKKRPEAWDGWYCVNWDGDGPVLG